MGEAIPSDHSAVDSYRVDVAGVGRTGRAQLLLPEAVDCSVGDIVDLTVDGDRLYAEIVSTLEDGPAIRGAYANRRLARAEEGENRLRTFFEDHGYGPGSTLVFDVVTDGYAYGLREPGTRVVYEAVDSPDSSLSDIADSLGE